MKADSKEVIEGVFQHLLYSPKGEIEGVLLEAEAEIVQIAIDRHDSSAAASLLAVTGAQVIRLRATVQKPSPHGLGSHPVYDLVKLVSIDGNKPQKPRARPAPAYRGKVVRFNFARHGEVNGVVLDSGDFIHTRPDGMARLRLKIGDGVAADGDAQRLADDAGWAVEATAVNGKNMETKR